MKKFLACLAVGLVAVAVSACGSNNASSASSGGGGSATATSTANTGAASAGGFHGYTQLKPGTVGILEVNAQSQRIQIWAQVAQQALADLGWKADVIDGKGDPSVWAQGLTTFTTQKVQGIITLAIDPASIAPQLKAAQAAGIPILTAGITVAGSGSQYYAGEYAPSDEDFGKVLAGYLKTKFASGTQFVQQDLTAVSGAHALITAADPLLKRDGFDLVGDTDLNPANLVPETASSATDLTQAHPQAKFMLSCCDFAPPVAVPALKQAGVNGVLVVARYDNPSNLALIRAGDPVVVAAADSDKSVMSAVDQIVRHYETGAAIAKTDPDTYKFSMVTAANVPKTGLVYPPGPELAGFMKKWEAEYRK